MTHALKIRRAWEHVSDAKRELIQAVLDKHIDMHDARTTDMDIYRGVANECARYGVTDIYTVDVKHPSMLVLSVMKEYAEEHDVETDGTLDEYLAKVDR